MMHVVQAALCFCSVLSSNQLALENDLPIGAILSRNLDYSCFALPNPLQIEFILTTAVNVNLA